MHGRNFTQLRAHFGAEHGRIRQAAGNQRQQRVADRPGLLEDLLLHVVPVRAPLNRLGAELTLHRRPFHGFAAGAGDLHAAAGQQRQVSIAQKSVAARYREQRGNVGSGIVLRLAQADHHGRAAMGGQDRVRLRGRQDDHGVTAFQSRQRIARSRGKVLACTQFRVDEVGDAFGVRFARENHAPGRELLLDRFVVLDNAVVRNRHPLAREYGMSVLFRGRAVRSPARVGDTDLALKGLPFEFLDQPGHLPGPAKAFQTAVVEQRQSGGVVAAVLQAAQPVQQQRGDVPLGRDSDNSAHGPAGLALLQRQRFLP